MSCAKQAQIETTGYAPWGYVSDDYKFSSEFSRNYMNAREPRIVENLLQNWTFLYSPDTKENKSFSQSEFDDSQWEIVQLPHTWMTYETTKDLHPFIMNASENDDPYWWKGWGYYRKKIEINPVLRNKRFFLEFDGVQKYGIVYINGKKAGEHKGGYNSFSIEITPFLDWNKTEQNITVSVNGYRRDKWSIPPMTAGNWDVYSGIYRPVRLTIKNNIYIPYQGNWEHEGGTYITTPFVKGDSAIVKTITYIKNDREKSVEISLVTKIVDRKDSVLAVMSENKILLPKVISSLTQQSPLLKNIKRWSDVNPVIYKVKTFVFKSDSLMDVYESPLGIRTFHWNYQTNDLYVNGKRTNIRGTNRHQEYPWLGDAIPDWLTLKDMFDIKYGLGINFMRTAHYPQSSLVYDFNNQYGIITVEELPNIKNIDFNDDVQEQNARAMVRRDRNNPCIFFWSVGNETNDAANSEWIFQEDTTRIIHARKAEGGGKYVRHTHLNLDMENLLRITHRGWFTPEDASSDINTTPENGQEAGNNLWQYEKAKIRNGSIRGDLNHNCVAWLYQDHGADRNYKNSLLTATNAKGWVDMYRIPKLVYFLTRANYIAKPMIYIHPEYWRKKFIGSKRTIYVDSNCDEVELFVNENSVGKKPIQKKLFNSVPFDSLTIKNGTLKVIGYKNHKQVASQKISMPGKPQKIILTSSATVLNDSNEYISTITAYIVDDKGTIVFDAAPDLNWEIKGEASLVGPELYKSDLDKKEARSGTGYETTPVSNVIRGSGNKGKIEITVTASDNIQAGKLTLYNEGYHKADGWIKQPELSTKNRKKTTRNLNFKEDYKFSSLIKIKLYNNILFKNTTNSKLLKYEIDTFLKKKEGSDNFYGIGYQALLEQITSIIKRTNGIMIGDDFNFLMEQYNMYLNIEQLIDKRMFQVNYALLLKKEYLKKIIILHEQVDYESICKEILSFPEKQKVCYVVFDSKYKSYKLNYDYVTKTYTIYTDKAHSLSNISKAFSLKDLPKVWSEIDRINPDLSYNSEENKIEFHNKLQLIALPIYKN
ncbi:MAG: glycoside hydrolase family 2 TIM barrel-domain containing protein [Paludibacter sp.]|nr:glycoside hydrolase family 2 TIM barrel-domain containing protein [Paludibacter sp.]